jgi:hypothetical protein
MDMDIHHLHVNVAWTMDIEHGHEHAARAWMYSMDLVVKKDIYST